MSTYKTGSADKPSIDSDQLLIPDWPAPANIHAFVTTRLGGVSAPPYESFNLAHHVGDQPAAVDANRRLLQRHLPAAVHPQWLEQVHGDAVVDAAADGVLRRGDAAITADPEVACVVMTADCLPVLLCDGAGEQVAAVHAGWRGLCGGVVQASVAQFTGGPQTLLAWLGPAIGPAHFEVGEEVLQAALAALPQGFEQRVRQAFRASAAPQRYWCDLYELARLALSSVGVDRVYGGNYCTFADSERFYSYRRDGVTGRMASVIYKRADAG